MNPTLHDLQDLALQAGEILRAHYGQRLKVTYKGLIDLVTEADHHSEAFLLGEIRRRFPDQRIMAEESGLSQGAEAQTWYIDPLDGTVNYAHGVPFFVVSIGYAEEGSMRLGVIYDPMREECFAAERGRGATLNGQPIHVADAPDLDHSLLVTGFPYEIRNIPETNLDHYAHFALRSQGVRRLGAAALDLCYIAAGRLDGYWELKLNAWDIAAGGLIAQEAGAVVTKANGEVNYLNPPHSVLAANPTIHALMLKELLR